MHINDGRMRVAWVPPYARRVKSDRLNWTWFHPSSRRIGIVQMKGLTLVVDCPTFPKAHFRE